MPIIKNVHLISVQSWTYLARLNFLYYRKCPGGVLPYMGYIGMCRGIGYGF